jgi:hypothetical protein
VGVVVVTSTQLLRVPALLSLPFVLDITDPVPCHAPCMLSTVSTVGYPAASLISAHGHAVC